MNPFLYNAGFRSYLNNEPFIEDTHPDWKAGWLDASNDHLIP